MCGMLWPGFAAMLGEAYFAVTERNSACCSNNGCKPICCLCPQPLLSHPSSPQHHTCTQCSLTCTVSPHCATASSVSTACLGMPQVRLINGQMPISCYDSPVGAVCTGSCNRGYGGPKPPTVTCVADARSPTGASWQEELDGACDPGERGRGSAGEGRGLRRRGVWGGGERSDKSSSAVAAVAAAVKMAAVAAHGVQRVH
jgi:hypothetical protein